MGRLSDSLIFSKGKVFSGEKLPEKARQTFPELYAGQKKTGRIFSRLAVLAQGNSGESNSEKTHHSNEVILTQFHYIFPVFENIIYVARAWGGLFLAWMFEIQIRSVVFVKLHVVPGADQLHKVHLAGGFVVLIDGYLFIGTSVLLEGIDIVHIQLDYAAIGEFAFCVHHREGNFGAVINGLAGYYYIIVIQTPG